MLLARIKPFDLDTKRGCMRRAWYLYKAGVLCNIRISLLLLPCITATHRLQAPIGQAAARLDFRYTLASLAVFCFAIRRRQSLLMLLLVMPVLAQSSVQRIWLRFPILPLRSLPPCPAALLPSRSLLYLFCGALYCPVYLCSRLPLSNGLKDAFCPEDLHYNGSLIQVVIILL